MDVALPDLFMKSLAGSYREGAIRCLLDLAETLSDRPAGMYDVARGQCRSLSEDPRRRRDGVIHPSARRDPKATRPFETIYEDALGGDMPVTHVLFLPQNNNLELAPFDVLGQSDLSEAIAAEEHEVGLRHPRGPHQG